MPSSGQTIFIGLMVYTASSFIELVGMTYPPTCYSQVLSVAGLAVNLYGPIKIPHPARAIAVELIKQPTSEIVLFTMMSLPHLGSDCLYMGYVNGIVAIAFCLAGSLKTTGIDVGGTDS